MVTDVSGISAAAELAMQVAPDRVLLAGPEYGESLRIWNGAVHHRPAVVVCCETPADVQAAVLGARRHHLALSVRGGGHDWAGRALRDGGLVIDLSRMRQVSVDASAEIATVAGGATAADVIAAAAPSGLVAATGTVGGVGMAGLTLGGGYGPVSGRFGLALDNLLGAEVVLADGRLVTADATHEPELYWALRGGGGNFGVVTSMRIRLHPLARLMAGFVVFPWSEAADVLGRLRKVVEDARDELIVQTAILSGPDGSPTLIVSPAWSGDLEQGQQAMDEISRLGRALASQVAPMAYADMLALYDAYVVSGRQYAIRTRSVGAYTSDVVSALLEAGSTRTSPLAGISIHHFHGAATRVPLESTAFGLRRPHLVVEIVAAWEPGDDTGARHRAWADGLSSALAPSALPGGYPNLLAADACDQIAEAYGPNAARLRAVKSGYDPDRLFSAIPLPLEANPR